MLFNASVTARLRRFPCRSILRQLQVSQPQNATYHIIARIFRKITSPKQSSKNEGGHVGAGSPSCWSGHDRQYWLDDLLPACTLFPVVPDRCGARGEAETKLITQEEREHVGNDRKRSRDTASCSGRVRPRISHRPGPLCRGGSLQEDHPGDPSMAARFLRNQCLSDRKSTHLNS